MMPFARLDRVLQDQLAQLPERDHRDESLPAGLFEEHRARVGVEELARSLRHPAEDRVELEQSAHIPSELGQGRHLARPALGLLVEAGVLDRDPDVGRDRG